MNSVSVILHRYYNKFVNLYNYILINMDHLKNIYIYIYVHFTHFYIILSREMLTNALRALVYKLFLETFYCVNDKIINIVDNFLYFP